MALQALHPWLRVKGFSSLEKGRPAREVVAILRTEVPFVSAILRAGVLVLPDLGFRAVSPLFFHLHRGSWLHKKKVLLGGKGQCVGVE